MSSKMTLPLVSAENFFSDYHGRPVHCLRDILRFFRETGRKIIFLAGDSSFDNVHWIFPRGSRPFQFLQTPEAFLDDASSAQPKFTAPALNGYEHVFSPVKTVNGECPMMSMDVCYWVNYWLVQRGLTEYVAVNCAVEESTIEMRKHVLPRQDTLIQHFFCDGDILILSMGGNDVALRPLPSTQWAVAKMMLSPKCVLGASHGSVTHFRQLFKTDVEAYIVSILSHARPRVVIPCFIYALDENPNAPSWAGLLLQLLGYNMFPSILQSRMRAIYEQTTAKIEISGACVLPLTLSDALDGKDTNDYINRVEPSVQGGNKMGAFLVDQIKQAVGN